MALTLSALHCMLCGAHPEPELPVSCNFQQRQRLQQQCNSNVGNSTPGLAQAVMVLRRAQGREWHTTLSAVRRQACIQVLQRTARLSCLNCRSKPAQVCTALSRSSGLHVCQQPREVSRTHPCLLFSPRPAIRCCSRQQLKAPQLQLAATRGCTSEGAQLVSSAAAT